MPMQYTAFYSRKNDEFLLIFYIFWLTAFMSFSDTESVFLDVALHLEILQGSPFHLLTIWANNVHSQQATWSFRRQTISSPSPT